MRLRLQELQESNSQAQKVRAEGLQENGKYVEGVLHYQGLAFVLGTIRTEFISQHHDNSLAGHFGIEKT